MTLGKEEIEHRFGFHKATVEGAEATLPRHHDVRLRFREFAEFLDVMVTDSRAKSVMFTELENASMWAHKAIAESAPLIGEELQVLACDDPDIHPSHVFSKLPVEAPGEYPLSYQCPGVQEEPTNG